MTEIKLNIPGTVITCGESKLVGEVIDNRENDRFNFLIEGSSANNCFTRADWTFSYPIPTLPTEVGTVIESGGVRFMKSDTKGSTWVLAKSGAHGLEFWKNDAEMLAYLKRNGGFTILLPGIDHKRREEG